VKSTVSPSRSEKAEVQQVLPFLRGEDASHEPSCGPECGPLRQTPCSIWAEDVPPRTHTPRYEPWLKSFPVAAPATTTTI
jgi:hypothetical protein